jgi:hypothetical protein
MLSALSPLLGASPKPGQASSEDGADDVSEDGDNGTVSVSGASGGVADDPADFAGQHK